MELLYLWIKEYKGLKDVGVNLSNRYRFQYYPQEKILDVKPVENYIPDFFGENITNLTALLGENGSGKTSVLRYIMEYCASGIHGNRDEQAIIVFRKEEEYKYYSFLDLTVKTPVGNLRLKSCKDLDDIKSAAIAVFLSNTFDITSFYSTDYSKQQLGENKNLSTWNLLQTDYQTNEGKDANDTSISFNQKLEAHASQEFKRMVYFLSWLNKKGKTQKEYLNGFPVKPPPYFNITFYQVNELKNDSELTLMKDSLHQFLPTKRGPEDRFMLDAFIALIYHLVYEAKFVSGPEFIKTSYYKIPQLIRTHVSEQKNEYDSRIPLIADKLTEIIDELINSKDVVYIIQRVSEVKLFLQKLLNFISKTEKVKIINNVLTMEISDENKLPLGNLIDSYYKISHLASFANFYFSHQPIGESSISSGEYALFSIFARLNDLRFENSEKETPLLLLIDEAELGLHPQWQKEFVYYFTSFINERFADHKVQIILTSHSPFVLSDLPLNCVVLLKKEGGSTSVLNNLESKNETFGANIHELFTDSFFLKDGLMGEFSRRKIEELIEDIKQEDDNSVTLQIYKDKYRPRIDMIGEQFLKAKILELVASKGDYATVDSIIERRTKELDILNQIREQKAYDQNRKSKS